MTDQNNNNIIAEFMGFQPSSDKTLWYDPHANKGHMMLKYHTSWDWLMPVVEKIEDLGNEICNEYFWNKDDAKQHQDFRIFRVKEILELHRQVVEFIHWHTTTTQSK